MLDLIKQTIL